MARSEEIVRKGFGAIPGYSIAAGSVKVYMDVLEAEVRRLNEGLTTGAMTNKIKSMIPTRAQMENLMEGVKKEATSPVDSLMRINEAIEAYGAGEHPEFPRLFTEGIFKAQGELLHNSVYPEKKLEEELDEIIRNGRPEDYGGLLFKGILIAIDIGTKGQAGGAYMDLSEMLETMANHIGINQGATGTDGSGFGGGSSNGGGAGRKPGGNDVSVKIVNGYEAKVNLGQQNKHILGTNEHKIAMENGQVKSLMYGNVNDIQKLLDEYAGTGTMIGSNKERVDFGIAIGKYIDPDTLAEYETTIGIIHYGKKGAHIVPARPK